MEVRFDRNVEEVRVGHHVPLLQHREEDPMAPDTAPIVSVPAHRSYGGPRGPGQGRTMAGWVVGEWNRSVWRTPRVG